MKKRTVLSRFESKFELVPCGCWIWKGRRDTKGYGLFDASHSKIKKAHRQSWELYRGTIPSGLYICHKCDTPPCVNPDHLFLGTAKDNYDDSISKGRRAPAWGSAYFKFVEPKGEKNWNSKLTEKDVLEIRKDKRAHKAIAATYSISRFTVGKIKCRQRWNHI